VSNEADTCRKFVTPKLQDAGWEDEPNSLSEQRSIMDGCIWVIGKKEQRRPQKRVDYLLRYAADFPIAFVEAKRESKSPGNRSGPTKTIWYYEDPLPEEGMLKRKA